eukprot:g8968.t1
MTVSPLLWRLVQSVLAIVMKLVKILWLREELLPQDSQELGLQCPTSSFPRQKERSCCNAEAVRVMRSMASTVLDFKRRLVPDTEAFLQDADGLLESTEQQLKTADNLSDEVRECQLHRLSVAGFRRDAARQAASLLARALDTIGKLAERLYCHKCYEFATDVALGAAVGAGSEDGAGTWPTGAAEDGALYLQPVEDGVGIDAVPLDQLEAMLDRVEGRGGAGGSLYANASEGGADAETPQASLVDELQEVFAHLGELRSWLRTRDHAAVEAAGAPCFLGYFLSLHQGRHIEQAETPRKAFLHGLVSPFLFAEPEAEPVVEGRATSDALTTSSSTGVHFITRFQIWLDRLAHVFAVFSQKTLHQLEVLLRAAQADVTASAKEFLQMPPRSFPQDESEEVEAAAGHLLGSGEDDIGSIIRLCDKEWLAKCSSVASRVGDETECQLSRHLSDAMASALRKRRGGGGLALEEEADAVLGLQAAVHKLFPQRGGYSSCRALLRLLDEMAKQSQTSEETREYSVPPTQEEDREDDESGRASTSTSSDVLGRPSLLPASVRPNKAGLLIVVRVAERNKNTPVLAADAAEINRAFDVDRRARVVLLEDWTRPRPRHNYAPAQLGSLSQSAPGTALQTATGSTAAGEKQKIHLVTAEQLETAEEAVEVKPKDEEAQAEAVEASKSEEEAMADLPAVLQKPRLREGSGKARPTLVTDYKLPFDYSTTDENWHKDDAGSAEFSEKPNDLREVFDFLRQEAQQPKQAVELPRHCEAIVSAGVDPVDEDALHGLWRSRFGNTLPPPPVENPDEPPEDAGPVGAPAAPGIMAPRRRQLVYTCAPHTLCGGHGDRVQGIVNAFVLALLLDRDFYVDSDNPVPLGMLFTPYHVDWRVSAVDATMEMVNSHDTRFHQDLGWLGDSRAQTLLVSTNLREVGQFLNHPRFQTKAIQLGLLGTPYLAHYIWRFLLRPGFFLQNQIQDARDTLQIGTWHSEAAAGEATQKIHYQPYLALHFRAGNESRWWDPSRHGMRSLAEDFFRCAERVEEELFSAYPVASSGSRGGASLPGIPWYLATDTARVADLPEVQALVERGKLKMLNVDEISHVDRSKGSERLNGIVPAWVSWYLVGEAAAVILSRSGFGETAAEVGSAGQNAYFAGHEGCLRVDLSAT